MDSYRNRGFVAVVSRQLHIMKMASLIVALTGCGGIINSGPVSVTGKVTYNGKPVTGGVVTLIPVSPTKGQKVEAPIEEGGTFQLTSSSPGKGVVPGEYFITLTPTVRRGKPEFSVRYRDIKYTDFVETITGSREMTLELKDE